MCSNVLLNKASITTIHSFCLEVIKSNFHKINLDPNFRIGDTTECNLLKQEAIEDVLEDLYIEQDKDFLNLVESYAEKRGDNELQNIILSIYSFAMASPYPKEWLIKSAEDFNIDDNFVLFLREEGKEMPYFAVNVEDIEEFQ